MKAQKTLFIFFLFISSFIYAQKTIQHKVSKGETIYSISKKYITSERSIYKLNKKIKKKPLQIGQILEVPYSKKYAKLVKKQRKTKAKTPSNKKETHIVAKGETLYQISKKYGISVEKLIQLNPEVASSLPLGYSLKLERTTNTKPEKPRSKKEVKKAESSKVATLIKTSHQYLGTRYRSGGTTKKGFDCSGLMLVTYKGIDMNLPRSSSEQARVGKKINKSKAKKGDLIFFATGRRNRINHVGMITQVNGSEIQFIHASTSSGVIVSSTKEAYYSKRYVQVNRVL